MVIKDGRSVDYNKILHNIDEMINALEYDSMRSAGKCKINVPTLNDLYVAKTRYEKLNKTTPKKEG